MSGKKLKVEEVVGPRGKWRAKKDGSWVYSDSRDLAIYYAGWWSGRKELLIAVKDHVFEGSELDERCKNL